MMPSNSLLRLVATGSGVLLLLGGCGGSTLFGDSGNGGGGGSGGNAGTGGSNTGGISSSIGGSNTGGSVGGGTPGCSVPGDCPPPGLCRTAECVENLCIQQTDPLGTSCGEGEVCDGTGNCVLSDGEPCDQGGACLSGNCVDDVCCESVCDGLCESCRADGALGQCTPHAPGTDPQAECSPGVCDGGATCVSGEHIGSDTFGSDNNSQIARGVATDSLGNIIVVGYFFNTITFDTTHTSAGDFDVFIAKLDPAGMPIWSQRFGDASAQRAWDVAVAPNDDIVVVGRFEGVIDFGTNPLTAATGQDAFVARFDASGTHLWSRSMAVDSAGFGPSVAVDQNGKVAVVGHFQNTVNFGTGAIASAGDYDGYVAVYEANGTPDWSAGYGDASDQRVYGVQFDTQNNILITGRFFGDIDLGSGTLSSNGARDIFLAKLTPSGSGTWSNNFGDESDQLAWNVAVDTSGNIAITGYNYGTVNFGGSDITAVGGQDLYVASFDGSGAHRWSSGFGNTGDQEAFDVTFDDLGHVLLVGETRGELDFGSGPLTNGGQVDAFVVKLNNGGEHLWSYLFGGGGFEIAHAVVTDTMNNVVVVGFHSSATNFGGGALTPVGNNFNAFFAKLAP